MITSLSYNFRIIRSKEAPRKRKSAEENLLVPCPEGRFRGPSRFKVGRVILRVCDRASLCFLVVPSCIGIVVDAFFQNVLLSARG